MMGPGDRTSEGEGPINALCPAGASGGLGLQKPTDQTVTTPGPGASPALPLHPLCVDLDGTLIVGDSSRKLFVRALRVTPVKTIGAVARAGGASAAIKRWLSAGAPDLDRFVATLEIAEPVYNFAAQHAASGRTIVLATGADQAVADAVRRAYPVFTEVVASDGVCNMTGRNKAAQLQALYPEGFDYIGNAAPDIHVWQAAVTGYAWGCPARVLRRARAMGLDVLPLNTPSSPALDAGAKGVRQ